MNDTDSRAAVMQGLADIKPALGAWFGQEIAEIFGRFHTRREGILLACPVWGEKYRSLFFDYCLPSILASGRALNGWAHLLLHVEPAALIDTRARLLPLEDRGIKTIVRPIPADVMAVANKASNAYWVLGTAENLAIHWAGAYGLGFHPLKPDHIFNPLYFASLRALSALEAAVAQITISGTREGVLPALEQYRHEATLAIDAVELGDLAWRNLHPRYPVLVMNDASIPDRMPKAFQMIWRGRDRLELACCHVNPMWINPRQCREAPAIFPACLDTRAAWYLPEDVYVPSMADGLTFIEVTSTADKPAYITRCGADEFAAECWATSGFADHFLDLFSARSQVPIKSGDNDWLSDEEIARQHGQVIDILRERQMPAALAAMKSMFGSKPKTAWALGA